MRFLRGISLWAMMFLFFSLCAGCTGNSSSEIESPDISAARQHYYQEGRMQLVNWVKASGLPPEYLPDCSTVELEKSKLGQPIPVWKLEQGPEIWGVEFSPEKRVTDQVVPANAYLFPVLVSERIVADYQADVENGQFSGSTCGLYRSWCACEVAKANALDVQQCYLIAAPGEAMFLFAVADGKEICSDELGRNTRTHLTMNEINLESFKSRVSSYNQRTTEPAPSRPGENAPPGKTPPMF